MDSRTILKFLTQVPQVQNKISLLEGQKKALNNKITRAEEEKSNPEYLGNILKELITNDKTAFVKMMHGIEKFMPSEVRLQKNLKGSKPKENRKMTVSLEKMNTVSENNWVKDRKKSIMIDTPLNFNTRSRRSSDASTMLLKPSIKISSTDNLEYSENSDFPLHIVNEENSDGDDHDHNIKRYFTLKRYS